MSDDDATDDPSDAAAAAAFAAAKRGDVQAVMNLLATGAALVRAKDVNGWTLLHVFARLSMAAPVGALLALGANTEDRDTSFRSPLHLAARADASPTLAAGAPAAAPPPPGADGAPASRDRQAVETLRVLLKGGARVTAKDAYGLTTLHHAAQAGREAVVEFLLGLATTLRMPRAPIESETNAEERALHLAAAGGHASTVRCLLKHNANPSHTNYLQQTALHLAALGGDGAPSLATVRELVGREWRLDLNPRTRDGSTPLHLAAAAGHLRVVGELLAAPNIGRRGGARAGELEAADAAQRTPSARARAQGFDDVVAWLEAAAAAARDKAARAPAEQAEALRAAMADVGLDAKRHGGSGSGSNGGGRGMHAASEDAELSRRADEAMLDEGEEN